MKIYGPYLRKDKRKHVVIIHDDGRRQTKSWPRMLMEQHIGRTLIDEETIDHIDNDFTNDNIDNLQIISLIENVKKQHSLKPKEMLEVICACCGKSFQRETRIEKRRIKKQMSGPYCSKSCTGRVHN